jgi:hypothetical protein
VTLDTVGKMNVDHPLPEANYYEVRPLGVFCLGSKSRFGRFGILKIANTIYSSMMYKWCSLPDEGRFESLVTLLPETYNPRQVATKLSTGLSAAVKNVLIEYDYTDKDYRSTYYRFYAKMGRSYPSECARLHFFDGQVTFDESRLALRVCDKENLSDHYFGFMVLRPTRIATIGRSVVSPRIRTGVSQFQIAYVHKVHLLGYKLSVMGFPSMDQHTDIAVCAHVACWSILRHYSERYSLYREYLTHDITQMAEETDPGGLVPSGGLQLRHAERVFRLAGTFPLLVTRRGDHGEENGFYDQLLAYLQSGFPLFAAMHNRGHAVVVSGHDWKENSERPTGDTGHRLAWQLAASLSVVDDNHLPYLSIPVAGGTGSGYSALDIDAFIVPLPEKVYYPATAVDHTVGSLVKIGREVEGLLPDKDLIVRYFLTTASAIRTSIRAHESEFPRVLLESLMTAKFAQFVWVVEFCDADQWDRNLVEARALLDAASSLTEPLPLWHFYGATIGLAFDRRQTDKSLEDTAETLEYLRSSAGFTRLDHNLDHIVRV